MCSSFVKECNRWKAWAVLGNVPKTVSRATPRFSKFREGTSSPPQSPIQQVGAGRSEEEWRLASFGSTG